MEKKVNSEFQFDEGNKRFHRFRIDNKQNMVDTVYVSKDIKAMPKRLMFGCAKEL